MCDNFRTWSVSFLYALVDLAVFPFAVVGFVSWTRGPSLRREAKELAAMQAKSPPSTFRALAMRHYLRHRGHQPPLTSTSPDLEPAYNYSEDEESCGVHCDEICGDWGCGVVVARQELDEKVPICGDEVVVHDNCAIVGLRGFTALVVDVDLPLLSISPAASTTANGPATGAAIAASTTSRHGLSWSESRLTLRHAALPSAPSTLDDGIADPVATPALATAQMSAAISGAASEIEVASVVPDMAADILAAEVHPVVDVHAVGVAARDNCNHNDTRVPAERDEGEVTMRMTSQTNSIQEKEPLRPLEDQLPLGSSYSQPQAAVGPSANHDRALLAAYFDGYDGNDNAEVAVSQEAHASSTGAISRGPTESVIPASDVQFLRRNVVGSFGYSWTLRVQCISAGILALADVFFVPSLIVLLATRYRLGPHRRKVRNLLISFSICIFCGLHYFLFSSS